MTVRDLIRELGYYDPDRRVLIELAADPGRYYGPEQTFAQHVGERELRSVVLLCEGVDA